MRSLIRNYLGGTSSQCHVAFATQDYTTIKDIVSIRKERDRFSFMQLALTRTQKQDNILAALIYLQTIEPKHFFDQRR
ncbi:MAG: hypothetical protein A2Z77_00385 [Chloroflexi bacterium RBG_13_51_36]|nr:MAG: hypothetical protein A2Z77_00385 [Chloroflexi bacterium RBG_13_51_36]